MFLLALSYHFGFSTASAQGPGNPVVGASLSVGATGSQYGVVVTANGDVYVPTSSQSFCSWSRCSNIFSGNPVPAQRATWGQVKARYAPDPATPTSQTNDR
jgi:hypothetical protein